MIDKGPLKDYAQRILDDPRWEILREMIDRELFDHWCGTINAEERERVHQEYMGFRLFSSKLKALATDIKSGDRDK